MDTTAIVATVLVGAALALVVGLFAWSAIGAVRGARVRGALRDLTGLALPVELEASVREPTALRAPFALTARGSVVDVGQSWLGTFRGGEVGLVDAHVRLGPRAAPTAHTIVTVDVDRTWPWLRLRHREADAVQVEVAALDLDVAGGTPWLVEAADDDQAAELVTAELLRWLERLGRPVVVELLPRHLLVAVPERVEDDLADLLEVALGVVDHVPSGVGPSGGGPSGSGPTGVERVDDPDGGQSASSSAP